MHCPMLISAVVLCFISTAKAQQQWENETVWGSVIFTAGGQVHPDLIDEQIELSPLGAQQLFAAGSAFRQRYIFPEPNGAIEWNQVKGISQDKPNSAQISILSSISGRSFASAREFMNGLYPEHLTGGDVPSPQDSNNDDNNTSSLSEANQDPSINRIAADDPLSIEISGNTNCPFYDEARLDLLHDPDIYGNRNRIERFYDSLYHRALAGHVDYKNLDLLNAQHIWEVLDYQYTYNRTVRRSVSALEVLRARYIADKIALAANTQPFLSAGHRFSRAVAGRALTNNILKALERNIQSQGQTDKMALVFGDKAPMMAFAFISGLSAGRPWFQAMPDHGASMAFELYSKGLDSFPASTTDLNVRFISRNDTDPANSYSTFVSYPLFGQNATEIPYNDFKNHMLALTLSVPQWCSFCHSKAPFCKRSGANNNANTTKPKNLSDSVAGLIFITIGVPIILVLIAIVSAIYCFRGKSQARKTKKKDSKEIIV